MDKEVLRELIPINSLMPENFGELADTTYIENLSHGSKLFQQGDNDHLSVYLLSGEVTLTAEDGKRRTIVAGTDEARYALAQLKPRQYTGVARTDVTIARVDSALLDRLLTLDQTAAGGIEVTEFAGDLDVEWTLRMLRSEAFRKLPASNANAMFTRMEPMPVRSGQVIIRQGDPGDYYYLIKSGKANVSRKADKTNKVSVLGELGEGDSFGEEALLSGVSRNATVIMMGDGVLLRLSSKDFDYLLKEPLVQWVTMEEAKRMARAGAELLDVRLEDEYRNDRIKRSINVPLYLLRMKISSLDDTQKYIVICQTGSRSCSAAFILSQRGFDVYVLRGGLNGLPSSA